MAIISIKFNGDLKNFDLLGEAHNRMRNSNVNHNIHMNSMISKANKSLPSSLLIKLEDLF
jgi:hypothetical protein